MVQVMSSQFKLIQKRKGYKKKKKINVIHIKILQYLSDEYKVVKINNPKYMYI